MLYRLLKEMRKLLKSYKTEINPSLEQKRKIHQTIGVCRFVYNFYLAENQKQYKETQKFVSANTFSKWLNNEFIPNNEYYNWIKEVSSKSVKKSLINAERAYKNFFKGQTKFPKFKQKKNNDVKMYFVKTDAKAIIHCERHKIKIPTLGWIKLKEKGYIPTNPDTHTIKSGTVSYRAGRYYVSVLVEEKETEKPQLNDIGIGIDLGLKDFAILSNGKTYKNINKTQKIRKLEKSLKRQQRKLSGKYEHGKQNKNSCKEKGGTVTQPNINKQVLKVQKLHQRINNIRTDYINKVVSEIAKTKPSYITIEDLNVSGMMKNRHLSKSVKDQSFFEFRTKLTAKCKQYGIELRIVNKFYPSSKTCHNCGHKKSDLKLSDRIYVCPVCGYMKDRDYNAALNLRDAEVYKAI